MKKYSLVLLFFVFFTIVFEAEAQRRRRGRRQAQPTAQDAYDFSFSRFSSSCKSGPLEFEVQLRSKIAEPDEEELATGPSFFFIRQNKKIAVFPGVDSDSRFQPVLVEQPVSAVDASDGEVSTPEVPIAKVNSLCDAIVAEVHSVGRIRFSLKLFQSAEGFEVIKLVWDTKSNRITKL